VVKPRLSLSVRPKHVSPGAHRSVSFVVTVRGRPLVGAKVKVAGRTKYTDSHGVARFDLTLAAGSIEVRALARGYTRTSARLAVG